MTPLVALTATALIMGGTGHPLSTPQDSPEFINSYTTDANNDYIVLTGFCGAGSCTPTAVSTPEQFMPVSGTMPFDQSVGQGVTNLDQAINAQPAGESIVVFGYSQSARIASIEKGNLAAAGSTLPVSFVLIGNPNRPNGGILRTLRGPRDPHSRSHFRRGNTHQHRLQDRRHHPPVRRLVRLPDQPAQSVRHRECRCGDPVSASATIRASASATRCIRARTETPTTT